MFEEEAQQYAENKDVYGLLSSISEHLTQCDFGTIARYDIDPLTAESFKDGAEFGYKTKWHKVADGDLPKVTEFVESDVLLLLVQLKGTEHKRYELGRYIFSGNVFTYTHLKLVEDVVAWCEIPTYTEE